MKSIIQDKKECYFCKTTQNLEDHHIFFGTANRKVSEKYGLKVWLCHDHHTGTNESVHQSKLMDRCLKILGQEFYECNYGDRNDFRRDFGKSYL